MRFRFAFPLAATLLLSALPPSTARGADLEQERSRFRDYNAEPIYDFEVLREIREQLGGTADQVTLIVSACHSGGFSNFAPDWLQGDYSASAGRKMKSNVDVEWHEEDWYDKKSKRNTKTGLKINETEYAHGWLPQVFRAIQDDKNRTAKGIHDFAKDNDYEGSAGPQYQKGGNGDAAKLRPATGKARAIYWHTACEKNDLIKTGYEVLKGADFTAAEIKLAYADGANDIDAPVDESATKDALLGDNGMIKWLKTQLAGGNGSKFATIILSSRKGACEKAKVPKAPNAQTQQRKQGRVVTPGDSAVTLALNDEFVEGFFAGQRPGLTTTVGLRPTVTFTTSEETYSGTVTVLIDGQSAGTVSMLGSSSGGTYEVVLSPSAWALLDTSGALDDAVAQITFSFPSGSFRVATEWDFELDHLRHYGVGLATSSVGFEYVDPSPFVPGARPIPIAVMSVLALLSGAAFLARSRRAAA